jgi:hypothetical protein
VLGQARKKSAAGKKWLACRRIDRGPATALQLNFSPSLPAQHRQHQNMTADISSRILASEEFIAGEPDILQFGVVYSQLVPLSVQPLSNGLELQIVSCLVARCLDVTNSLEPFAHPSSPVDRQLSDSCRAPRRCALVLPRPNPKRRPSPDSRWQFSVSVEWSYPRACARPIDSVKLPGASGSSRSQDARR